MALKFVTAADQAAAGTGASVDTAPADLKRGASPYPLYYNGGWQTTYPAEGAYYEDAWHNIHMGVDQGNGRTWFPDFAPERNGTAELYYGWATGENQSQASVSSPGSTGTASGNWVKQNVQAGEHEGQSGWTVENGQVANIGSNIVQSGRDNGKFAVKDKGFGFGSLLSIAAMALGVPPLATALGGGTFGSVAAGAIIGGTTTAAQGGDFFKGAIMGGVGGAVAGPAGSFAEGVSKNALVQAGVKGAITGAASGTAGTLLNGGGFGDVIGNAGKGAIVGAAGSVAGQYVFDKTDSNFAGSVASDATKTAIRDAITDDPSYPNVKMPTGTENLAKPLGFGFAVASSFKPEYIPPNRANMNWGNRRV